MNMNLAYVEGRFHSFAISSGSYEYDSLSRYQILISKFQAED